MNNLRLTKEYFSRLFVLCKLHKINMRSFTVALLKYKKIEISNEYSEIKSLSDVFDDITNIYITNDESFGIYDDAFWCGNVYCYIQEKTNKPLSYILLKMSFDNLINYYPLYHEMDYSEILDVFLEESKKHSILSLLCNIKGYSLPRLSKITGISLSTLKKYSSSDEYLYKASFQKIYALINVFDVDPSIFVE